MYDIIGESRDFLEDFARTMVIFFFLYFIVAPILIIWATISLILLLNAYRCYYTVKAFSFNSERWSMTTAKINADDQRYITYIAEDSLYYKKISFFSYDDIKVIYRNVNPKSCLVYDLSYWRKKIRTHFIWWLIPNIFLIILVLMLLF